MGKLPITSSVLLQQAFSSFWIQPGARAILERLPVRLWAARRATQTIRQKHSWHQMSCLAAVLTHHGPKWPPPQGGVPSALSERLLECWGAVRSQIQGELALASLGFSRLCAPQKMVSRLSSQSRDRRLHCLVVLRIYNSYDRTQRGNTDAAKKRMHFIGTVWSTRLDPFLAYLHAGARCVCGLLFGIAAGISVSPAIKETGRLRCQLPFGLLRTANGRGIG